MGVSQTFPWLKKLSLKGKIAIKEAEAVYQDYVNIGLKLNQRVKSGFYEYAYLAQAVRINKEHLNLLKAMQQVASIRFKAGSLTQTNLIQLQIEQGKIEDRVKELETLRHPLSAKLCADAGLKSSVDLPWADTQNDEIAQINKKNLNLFMLNHNPILKKTNLLGEKEKISLKLAKQEYFPDLTFGFNRIYVDGGDDPMNITASINIPIWFNRITAAKRQTIEKHESIFQMLKDQENQLSAQLDLLLYYFKDAQRKANLYTNTLIPKAKQSIDVALKGFETGKVNFADLLDAERTLLEFQLTAQRQKANSYMRLAQIEALVGEEFSIADQKNTKE
ncbi:TolC family protein [bacterium]|nr:TolC family protein [bacterium]